MTRRLSILAANPQSLVAAPRDSSRADVAAAAAAQFAPRYHTMPKLTQNVSIYRDSLRFVPEQAIDGGSGLRSALGVRGDGVR